MKNLAKIFMAVVALFAFSCTTDTTYDPTVELGAGQTTVTLSLDDENDTVESRTHITGKDGDHYPLYWSNGDQIALNGVASNKLEIAEGVHTKTATFTVDGEQARPWNIVYPAPAKEVKAETEGCYPVTFLAEQPYTANTFAEGSTPMYAYISESANTGLQHLAGVLRFDVKAPAPAEGETETKAVFLKAMVVEVAEGKIAGNFDVNCATGEVKPHSDATNSITVSFPGDGLKLVADATPIYVAVPAGEYGTATISLYTNEGSMRGTFSTDGAQKVKPGVIFEFGEVTYSGKTEEGTFFIYDEASLQSFAALVKADSATAVTAKVVADITLTDAWESINGFAGTFDGGNHTISNLDAPLFSTTQAAAIQNVHLTGVDIKLVPADGVEAINGSNTYSTFSALACSVNNENAVIENCSASGTMVVTNNSKYSIQTRYSGLIAFTTTTKDIKNLVNKVNITVEGSAKLNDTSMVAGCVATAPKAKLYDCQNLGNITASATFANIYLSGIAASSSDIIRCVNGCENGEDKYGKLTFSGTIASNNLLVSGITSIYTRPTNRENITDCTNYGYIEIGGERSGSNDYMYIGGVSATITTKNISGCTNYGNITCSIKSTNTQTHQIAGIGSTNGSAQTESVQNCANYGNIKVSESASITSKTTLLVYGVAKLSHTITTVNNLRNEGDITVNGTLNCNLSVGGITNMPDNDKSTYSGELTNSGDITVGATCSLETSVGGIFGKHTVDESFTWDGGLTLNNSGAIKATGQFKDVAVGGVFGRLAKDISAKILNTGDVTYSGAKLADVADAEYSVYVGGIAGTSSNTLSSARCYCNVAATGYDNVGMVTGSAYNGAADCHVGGSILKSAMAVATPMERNTYYDYIYGSEAGANAGTIVTADGCGWLNDTDKINAKPLFATNVSFNGETTNDLYVIKSADDLANFAAAVNGGTLTQTKAVVAADIDMANLSEGKTFESIGGYTGAFNGGGFEIKGLTAPLFGTTKAAAIKNVKLTDVAISTTVSGSKVVNYGVLACSVNNENAVIENCSASGTLTITGDNQTNTTRIGGLVANTTTANDINKLENDVDVTIDGTFGDAIVYAGCVANANTHYPAVNNCTNLGNLTINGTTNGNIYFAGVACQVGNLINCVNGSEGNNGTNGILTINSITKKQLFVGGVNANYSKTRELIDNCTNYGNIVIGGTRSHEKDYYMFVGGVSATMTATNISGCQNYGNITCSMSSTSKGTHQIAGIGCTYNKAETESVKNCTNYGKIEVSESASITSDNSLLVFGVAKLSHLITTVSNLRNEGDITVNGTLNCGLKVGGIANAIDKAGTYSGEFSNSGKISVGATCSGEASIGGLFGLNEESAITWSEGTTLNNSGEGIVVTGKFKDVAVGGVFGRLGIATSVKILNTGDVTYSGTKHADVADADYKVYVGGVAGALSSTLSDARCYCTVTALGYQNVGMITGRAYSETTKAKNCHIGGTLYRGGVLPEENSSTVIDLNEYKMDIVVYNSDWKAYIYQRGIYGVPMGSEPIDISIAVADGCGVLSESVDSDPEIPEL